MKKVYLIFHILLLFGCRNSEWGVEEKDQFIYDCIQAHHPQSICECTLSCIEIEFGAYEEAMQQITVNGVSIETEKCVKKCE